MKEAELIIKVEPLWKLLIKVENTEIYVVKCLRTGIEKAFNEKPKNFIDYVIYKNDIPNDYNAALQHYADFMAELEISGKTMEDAKLIKELTKYMKNKNKVLTKFASIK
jgi:hypothetical protein